MGQPHLVRSAPEITRRMIGVCVSLVLLPAAILAQAVPSRVLTTADAEYAEPFTSISGVREMRDGQGKPAASRLMYYVGRRVTVSTGVREQQMFNPRLESVRDLPRGYEL